MKRLSPTQLIALVSALGCSTPALAICEWRGGISGELVHNLTLTANLWVPRDAPIGTVIGPLEQRYNVGNDARLGVNCNNVTGTEYLTAQVANTAPIFAGSLPPIGGQDLNGRVLQTDVPGIGIHVRLDNPYTGGGVANYWTPDSWTSVPYTGYHNSATGPLAIEMANLRVYLTLIKTGAIPPGPNSFNGQKLLSGTYSDVGTVMRAHLHGTVTRAECTLRPDAVSADPVDLGDHELSVFTAEHTTTPSVPFHITLNDCEDDPAASTATAYINFDGVSGSTPIQHDLGLFSLNSVASATGIGIQLLHADGTPVRLQQDLAIKPLTVGDTQLHFQARYYQTHSSVKPGSAEGTLSFTVSYR
ncbi:type 1 fimbria pilin [Pseudomonas hunanensis]|uniref:Type 1 fimbria pilin n=1 Tax=Pseudomonas hunanensis TaxID=1247546 RepID=A0ACC6K8B3_9PSED|nr:fimbrial protein [Pseudomonas hunanensis]MDR6714648.1 type 1 fimbria pilin [Pseudomonas hunanensis]